MKNIFLSLIVFVVMSLLHAQFTEWAVKFLGLPGGDYGMFSYLILIFCAVITAIGLAVVIIFRKSYHSIVIMAVLFEVIYLSFLIISGKNPFLYFSKPTNENLLEIFMYTNAFIIFLVMFLIDLLYSKIISAKSKN